MLIDQAELLNHNFTNYTIGRLSVAKTSMDIKLMGVHISILASFKNDDSHDIRE